MNNIVGYRFHPTEDEIISYYLERKLGDLGFPVPIINTVDVICKYEPWELPVYSRIESDDPVWYFFTIPAYKYAKSKRYTERTTKDGFWKVTGKDRVIWEKQGGKEIGIKRNLVFHRGRSPNGVKTNWVMHEYHSNRAASYPKEFIFCRLKRKSEGKSGTNTRNEPSPGLASNSRIHLRENIAQQDDNPFSMLGFTYSSGINNRSNHLDHNDLSTLLSEIGRPEQRSSYSNGFNNGSNQLDHNDLSTLLSEIGRPEQRTSYSNGFNNGSNALYHNPLSALRSAFGQPEQGTSSFNGLNNGHNMSDFHYQTSEMEEDFVNSLFVPEARSSGERNVQTHLNNSNPPEPLREVEFEDSNDTDTESVQGDLFGYFESGNVSDGESYEEGEIIDGMWASDLSSVDTDTDFLEINCPVRHEFPINTRTFRAQYMPKSPAVVETKYAPPKAPFPSKVSIKATSNDKRREAALHAVDLSRKENSVLKVGKDQKMAETIKGKTNLKGSYNGSDGSIRKGSIISQKTSPLSHETNPPLVYVGNVLVGLILLLIFIMFLH